ncbi:MAG TPA: hypothetical protein VFN71_03210, partial [Methylomirabilota bacterium]|nr:hypothetical protein [Methylomirabilota bacterium]
MRTSGPEGLVLLAGFLIALCLAVLPRAAAAADVEDLLFDLQLIPLDGQPAPAFTLEALDGRRVSLGDFKGQAV